MGEMQHIAIPIYRNRHGWFTCRLSSESSCPFLGFRKFGQVPVCMKGLFPPLDFLL